MFQLASFDILTMLTIFDQLFIFLLEWAAESMSRPGSSHSSIARLSVTHLRSVMVALAGTCA